MVAWLLQGKHWGLWQAVQVVIQSVSANIQVACNLSLGDTLLDAQLQFGHLRG